MRGFTLVELFVALAVTAILLAIAIPSFKRMTLSNQLTATANDIVGAMGQARMAAIKHNSSVHLCSNSDAENDGDGFKAACGASAGAVYMVANNAYVRLSVAPSGLVSPLQLDGDMKALRFNAQGLAYATTSSTPYSGTVADVCTASISKDNHRVIRIAAGSIIDTRTTDGNCP